MTGEDPGVQVARRLLALAREEHGLIEDGRYEDLAAIDERRDALTAQIPRTLSPEGRSALEEVVDAQRQVAAALQLGLARATDEFGRVNHGRTAMAGYAPAGLDARPVLDHSA